MYKAFAHAHLVLSVMRRNAKLGLFTIRVFAGCADGSVCVWSTVNGNIVHALRGHAGVATSIQWHPRRMLIASACSALALWTPDPRSVPQPSYNFHA